MESFHVTVSTTKGIDAAVTDLQESLKQQKFGVLWQLDIPAQLKEKGVDFNTPYRVLEVCNPHEAAEVLSRNLQVGYFLPCKIVVYREGNETKIGLPRPTAMINLLADQELQAVAERVESQLIQAIKAAVK